MTAGAPIYLVSACSTGEEFVAAFRRYADRGSLFVPLSDPIPQGRHGRFAVTLTGGEVMLEGDAEVISSSKSPSILHGRVGITLRFSNLDDDSKTVLVELEKARVVARPPAPSVPPRTADVPAAPRPVPPATSARIDAANALAECVAIGDVAALETTAKAAAKGPKFVMPAVLPVGAPRPKTPSTPPELRPIGPLPGSAPLPKPPTGTLSRAKSPSVSPSMPSLAPLPGSSGIPTIPKPKTPSGPVTEERTESGPVPVPTRSPASGPIVATTPPRLDITPPRVIPPVAKRPPTPIPARVPSPVAASPSVKITMDGIDEPTDLTESPPSDNRERQPTALGVAVVTAPEPIDPIPPGAPTPTTMPTVEEPTPSGDWTMTPGASGPTILPRKPQPPKRPTGDWTIQRDVESPDGWSPPVKPEKPAVAPTTDDRPELAAVAREVEARTRWDPNEFEPEQPSIQIDPSLLGPILNPDLLDLEEPPVHVPPPPIASKPVEPSAPPTPATPPPGSIPPPDAVPTPPPSSRRVATPVPNAVPIMSAPSPDALHVAALMSPRDINDSASLLRDSSEVSRVAGTGSFPTGDSTSLVHAARKRRGLVIAISAGLVVAIGLVVLLAFGLGGGKSEAHDIASAVPPADAAHAKTPRPIDAAVVATVPDAAIAKAVPDEAVPDAAVEEAAVEPAPVPPDPPPSDPPQDCTVHVASSPNGAEVVRDKQVIGQTPATLSLPCDVEVKLAFRRARYTSTTRTVTATAEGAKVSVALKRVMYSIKVSSRPAGARVSLRGKTVAVTPSTMRLPAFERVTLTFVKPGYATQTKRVTVRQNHQTVHAKLKRRGR